MSVVATIGNIRDAKDLQRKRAEFFKTLKLQADLNKRYEDAMIQRSQMDRMGVQPVQQTPRSMEEERRDELGQQQIALRHLESILTPSQAMKAMKDLPIEQIYQLNTYWGRFKETIRGIRVSDADYFRRLFLNFLSVAKETEDFIRPIPLRESTLAKISGDLQDAWNGWARREIDPLTGKVQDLTRLIQQTAMATGRSMEDVKAEVADEQRVAKRIGDTLPRTPFETPEEALMTPIPEGRLSSPRPRLERLPSLPRPKPVLISQLALQSGVIENMQQPLVFGSQAQAVDFATAVRNADLAEALSYQQLRALLLPFTDRPAKSRAKAYKQFNELVLGSQETGRGIYVSERRAKGIFASAPPSGRGLYGTTTVQSLEKLQTPHLIYRGDGTLKMGMAKPVHLFGRGIAPQPPPIKRENNYRQFGKYLVNMKYLDEGVLKLYHETMKQVRAIPARLISKEFQNIIYTILEKGQLPRSLVLKLSEMEQNFLKDVLRRAWLLEKLGFGDQGRKKGMFEDDDAEMRRFNLLKGIIIAGNNDKCVLNEMKSYLHKFVEERRIDPKMGHDILRNLAIATY